MFKAKFNMPPYEYAALKRKEKYSQAEE